MKYIIYFFGILFLLSSDMLYAYPWNPIGTSFNYDVIEVKEGGSGVVDYRKINGAYDFSLRLEIPVFKKKTIETCEYGDPRCYECSLSGSETTCTMKYPLHKTLVDGQYFIPGHPDYAVNSKCGGSNTPISDLRIYQTNSRVHYKYDDESPICSRPYTDQLYGLRTYHTDEELSSRFSEYLLRYGDKTVVHDEIGSPYTGGWVNTNLRAYGLCVDNVSGCVGGNNLIADSGLLKHNQGTFGTGFYDLAKNGGYTSCSAMTNKPIGINRLCTYRIEASILQIFANRYSSQLRTRANQSDQLYISRLITRLPENGATRPSTFTDAEFANIILELRRISMKYIGQPDDLYIREGCEYEWKYEGGITRIIPPLIDKIVPVVQIGDTARSSTTLLDNERNIDNSTRNLFYAGARDFTISLTDKSASNYLNNPRSRWDGYNGISGIKSFYIELNRIEDERGRSITGSAIYSSGRTLTTEYNPYGTLNRDHVVSIRIPMSIGSGVEKAGKYRWTVIVLDHAGNRNESKTEFTVYAKLPDRDVDDSSLLSIEASSLNALDNIIADATPHEVRLTLKDEYGNAIIPIPQIRRQVSIGANITNTVYLDQFDKTRIRNTSSIAIGGTQNSTEFIKINNNSDYITFPGVTVGSTDSYYRIWLKGLSPTSGGYRSSDGKVSDINATFNLNRLNAVITEGIPLNGARAFTRNISNSINKSIDFRPLYTTSFSGEIKDGGFIEGALQNGSIEFKKNGSTPVSNFRLKVKYGGNDASKFNLFRDTTNQDFSIDEALNPDTNRFYGPFYLRLVQKSNSVGKTSNLNLSSHIQYDIDGKTVIYNSDVIGQKSYYGESEALGYQNGVKIIGTARSNSKYEIVDNQSGDINSFTAFGNFADIINALRKSIALAIRNIDFEEYTLSKITKTFIEGDAFPIAGGGTQAIVKKVTDNNSLLYIEGNGRTIELDISKIEGARTIVVNGGNIYIKRDMYYASSDDIIGIIALTDDAGRGGMIYIDPGVTNIVGAFVAQKAIVSYDGVKELGGETSIEVLKNQLYIYGSIISRNTMGGSRANPIICPKFMTRGSCTTVESQKYDLNYLRRYYLTNIGAAPGKVKPYGDGKIIGGHICDVDGICTSPTTGLVSKFEDTNNPLAGYPIIIEYNPLLSTRPPPLLELFSRKETE